MTDTSARTQKRNGRIDRLSKRKAVLEQTLIEVWRWTSHDGQNVDALRKILLAADPDADLHSVLDRLAPLRRNAQGAGDE